MPLHLTVTSPISRVTGAFTASGYNAHYIWSGVATTYTATLGTPSALSGASMEITNWSTGAALLLTGSVNGGLNYAVLPRAAVSLYSDASTWQTLL